MGQDVYGVVRGQAVQFRPEWRDDTPHFQLLLRAGRAPFRIAVNTRSNEPGPGNSDLLYLVDERFRHPVTERLERMPPGFTRVAKRPGGAAVDYLRANLFDPSCMNRIPAHLPGPENDLNDELAFHANRSIHDPAVEFFVVGNRWGPERGHPDEVFDFEPGNGVHDIHMNQGNTGRHAHGNGPWQDGAIFVRGPGDDRWVAIFLAFQGQFWHTDHRGDPVPAAPAARTPNGDTFGPGEPCTAVRIVAGMVNPVEGGERTVTLLNITPEDARLDGWSLADDRDRRQPLHGLVPAGQTRVVPIERPLDVRWDGGALTLYDPDGLRVHGVSWTKRETRRRGWTVAF